MNSWLCSGGPHIWGWIWCIFHFCVCVWVIFWGNLGFRGGSRQEIAGINTFLSIRISKHLPAILRVPVYFVMVYSRLPSELLSNYYEPILTRYGEKCFLQTPCSTPICTRAYILSNINSYLIHMHMIIIYIIILCAYAHLSLLIRWLAPNESACALDCIALVRGELFALHI